MSGIGWTEIFLVALILLIFVGPKRLPELFGKFAWVIAQLRAASRDLRNQLSDEMTELKQVKSDFTAEMKAQTDRLYAEARQLDDEFQAIGDDVKDSGMEIEKDLGDVSALETTEATSSESNKKEMKG